MLSLWGKELRRLKFIIASSYLQKKHDQNDLQWSRGAQGGDLEEVNGQI